MAKAKIGIVIATYNSGRTLRECLDSIQAQDFKDVDLYVQDGGSTDDTLAILSEYDFVRFSSEKDSGVYSAWNKALKQVNAEWIVFMGSDDYFSSPSALSSVLEYLNAADRQGLRLVYGRNILVDQSGGLIDEVGVPWSEAKNDLSKRMTIRHPGCFHHVSLFEKIGGFNENYKVIGDYHFILRALVGSDAGFYPFSIVSHRVGGLSNKPSLMMSIIRENFRLRKELALTPLYLVDGIFIKRLVIFLMSCVLGDRGVMKLLSIYGGIVKK